MRTQKASTEVFGVINIAELTKQQPDFVFYARMLDYPDNELLSDEFLAEFEQDFVGNGNKDDIRDLIIRLREIGLEKLKSNYVRIFELNNRYTLYMTYYKFVDSKNRGQMLAKLKMLYEMFGLEEVGSELADYLPLMLEFLSYSNFIDDDRQQDLELLFSVVEDGTFNILKNAKLDAEDLYFDIIKSVRDEMKLLVVQKEEVENAY